MLPHNFFHIQVPFIQYFPTLSHKERYLGCDLRGMSRNIPRYVGSYDFGRNVPNDCLPEI